VSDNVTTRSARCDGAAILQPKGFGGVERRHLDGRDGVKTGGYGEADVVINAAFFE